MVEWTNEGAKLVEGAKLCTFRTSYCIARLSQYLCPGQEQKRGRKEAGVGTACTGGYKRVQAVRPGSVAGGGCYGVM